MTNTFLRSGQKDRLPFAHRLLTLEHSQDFTLSYSKFVSLICFPSSFCCSTVEGLVLNSSGWNHSISFLYLFFFLTIIENQMDLQFWVCSRMMDGSSRRDLPACLFFVS